LKSDKLIKVLTELSMLDPFMLLLARGIVRGGEASPVPYELKDAAREIASRLASLPVGEAAQVMTAINAQVAKEYSEAHASLRSDPVPAEILAEAERSFDEAEILETIREVRGGGGRRLEEFLPELEQIASHQIPRG
jgi:hypothetical protein